MLYLVAPEGDKEEEPDAASEIEEFLKTSLMSLYTRAETQMTGLLCLHDVLEVIEDGLSTATCNFCAQKYSSVASAALVYADKLIEDVDQAKNEIYDYESRRRELCGEERL